MSTGGARALRTLAKANAAAAAENPAVAETAPSDADKQVAEPRLLNIDMDSLRLLNYTDTDGPKRAPARKGRKPGTGDKRSRAEMSGVDTVDNTVTLAIDHAAGDGYELNGEYLTLDELASMGAARGVDDEDAGDGEGDSQPKTRQRTSYKYEDKLAMLQILDSFDGNLRRAALYIKNSTEYGNVGKTSLHRWKTSFPFFHKKRGRKPIKKTEDGEGEGEGGLDMEEQREHSDADAEASWSI